MRDAFWFAVAFGLLFLVRVPFLPVHYVPYHIPFEPWVALVPLVGVLWGMPAILAVGLATGLADWMGGLRGALPAYHAVGMMLWAWSARVLWPGQIKENKHVIGEADAEESVTWSSSLLFLAVSVPGAFLAVVFTALGADLTRSYPFSYSGLILLGNHAVFMPVFGVMLYRLFERDIVPRFGSRDEELNHTRSPSALGGTLQFIGAIGAWSIGVVVAILSGYPSRGPAVLGDTVGLRLIPATVPFILLFVIGLFCPARIRTE